jgi:hypothetical protein
VASDTRTRDEERARQVLRDKGLRREVGRDRLGYSESVTSGGYLYLVARRWAPGGRTCTFGLLNPCALPAGEDSRDEIDPAIARCADHARYWGCNSLMIWSLFAMRAGSFEELRSSADPVGPRNDEFIATACKPGWLVVAAWGDGGTLHGRGEQVTQLLVGRGVNLHCLEFTSAGHPAQPAQSAALRSRLYREATGPAAPRASATVQGPDAGKRSVQARLAEGPVAGGREAGA